jgi:serine/threonine protein kinase
MASEGRVLQVEPPKRFRIVRPLGEGGMGIVYEAFDEERGARVALKTVRNLTPDSLARFKREFRALADLHHPNLVSLGELVSEGDRWFFTMELVEGVDLLSYVRPDAQATALEALTATVSMAGGEVALAPTAPFRRVQPDGAKAFDEQRLRSALAQLASALTAVHGAGMVHRDIKPANVRVTPQGRVVLLDFGLVADGSGRDIHRPSTDLHMAGTPAYMAPEQATSRTPGPEADWYAVGVILFEALTGALPFDGSPLDMMMKKQVAEPPPPSAHVAGLPEELDVLCRALLRHDPGARPSGSKVLRVLGVAAGTTTHSHSSLTHAPPFVGRATEVAALEEAYAATRGGRAVTVLVEGESGVGKSCLVRHFVEALAAQSPDAAVLVGRCYEREAVPYKALDGVVDALARLLARATEAEAARVLPLRPAALVQVFPVLRRVGVFARATRDGAQALDPFEIRSRAFAALRAMLVRLADERPLIVVIDDLQWADADSFALLSEVLRPPEAPALLLVATQRPRAGDVQHDAAHSLPGDVRTLPLLPLSDAEAQDLAAHLLARAELARGRSADDIAREAGGHPLFIDALVRHAAVVGENKATRLDDALWSRVAALEPSERAVVELLAVAGAPISHEALASAAGVEPQALQRELHVLRVAHLASITGTRAADTVELYHDRVRTAVLARMDGAACEQRHGALAAALERAGSTDVEALARHWGGAGDAPQSAKYTARAADAAASALAFDRAAAHYEHALAIGRWSDAEARALREKLGDALANAGLGARAAEAYRVAARGAATANALDLQRRAADQLLRAGHFDEGLDLARAMLREIRMRLPQTAFGALVSLLLWRFVLWLRGTSFRVRDTTQIAARDLTRVDVCWSVATNLALVDNVRGTYVQSRGLLLALRAGEPTRIARSMALEAAFVAIGGGRATRRTARLLARTRPLVERASVPEARAWLLTGEGSAALLSGRWREAAAAHAEGERIFNQECVGVAWEVTTARWFRLWAHAYLGQLRELSGNVRAWLRDGEARGDLRAVVGNSTGLSALVWLSEDRPDEARRVATEAMQRWSHAAFHVQHWWDLLGQAQIDLYAGDGERALARIDATWRPLERSMLLMVQLTRLEALDARARSALAAAERTPQPAALLGRVHRDARRIAKERMPWASPLACMLEAGALSVSGDRERAIPLLREAASGFDGADMALHAAAARRCLGGVLGGDEGARLREAASTYFAAEGVADPARMAAMLAPGFGRVS